MTEKEKPLEINIRGKRMASGGVKRVVQFGGFNAEFVGRSVTLMLKRPRLWNWNSAVFSQTREEVFRELCDELIAEIRKLNKRQLIRQLEQAKKQAPVIVGEEKHK